MTDAQMNDIAIALWGLAGAMVLLTFVLIWIALRIPQRAEDEMEVEVIPQRWVVPANWAPQTDNPQPGPEPDDGGDALTEETVAKVAPPVPRAPAAIDFHTAMAKRQP